MSPTLPPFVLGDIGAQSANNGSDENVAVAVLLSSKLTTRQSANQSTCDADA